VHRGRGRGGPARTCLSTRHVVTGDDGLRLAVCSYMGLGMHVSGREERAWVRGAQAGSASDLEALYRTYWPRAYRAAYLVVHDAAGAEDIAQEAFMAAVRSLERFDRRRPFGPWLHRIVVNRAIDWARARTLRGEIELTDLPATDWDPRGEMQALVRALARLPPEQRAVIVLRHLLEYTPGEIARLLDLPRGTVNSRLRRGLDQLAASFEEET
jgi:RNA polymerase sigma-70 factor (ECF subfamily)